MNKQKDQYQPQYQNQYQPQYQNQQNTYSGYSGGNMMEEEVSVIRLLEKLKDRCSKDKFN